MGCHRKDCDARLWEQGVRIPGEVHPQVPAAYRLCGTDVRGGLAGPLHHLFRLRGCEFVLGFSCTHPIVCVWMCVRVWQRCVNACIFSAPVCAFMCAKFVAYSTQ